LLRLIVHFYITLPATLISPSVIDQAVTLRADKDWDALEELRKRGLLVFAAAGQELRAEHYDLTIDTVRKPGSPDRWYALRSGLDCTQPPKTK
jgi:hypothetical protein